MMSRKVNFIAAAVVAVRWSCPLPLDGGGNQIPTPFCAARYEGAAVKLPWSDDLQL